jgi:hypothetical protein
MADFVAEVGDDGFGRLAQTSLVERPLIDP